MKILIMGLPGSGKSTLAKELKKQLIKHGKTVEWFNADEIRKKFNDWDFSQEGRLRQADRMKALAENNTSEFTICDFVAPLPEMREIFNADWIIWVDTIEQGRFEDTNKVFIKPDVYDFRIKEQDCKKWAKIIVKELLPTYQEQWWRSILKAASYRCCGTLTTIIISYTITGRFVISLGIGATELLIKPFIYWMHERIWNKIKLGKFND